MNEPAAPPNLPDLDEEDSNNAVESLETLPNPVNLTKEQAEKVEKLKKALGVNLKYQEFLKQQVAYLVEEEEMHQEKKRIIVQKMQLLQPKKIPLTRKMIFGAPFFVDKDGNVPPENQDVLDRKVRTGDQPTCHTFASWTKEERVALQNGIRSQNRKSLIEKEKKAHKDRVAKGEDEAESKVKLEKETTRVEKSDSVDLLLDTQSINWEDISKNFVPTRTAVDCQIDWNGNVDPRINGGEWTKEEDKQLLELIKEHGGHKWQEVALQMKNRTPMQCLQRYQRSHNSNLLLWKWTPAEDKKLKDAVLRYGDRNWKQVAAVLERRTDQQCWHRWTKSVNKSIKSGRWSQEEDDRLRLAVKVYGAKHWSRIQRHVPGRTDVKCRERYVNILKPDIITNAWEDEENAKLLKYVAEVGIVNVKW